jgi:hypothetical protein
MFEDDVTGAVSDELGGAATPVQQFEAEPPPNDGTELNGGGSWVSYYWKVLKGDRNGAATEYAKLQNQGDGDVVAGPENTQPEVTQQDVDQVAPPGSKFTSYGANLLKNPYTWAVGGALVLIGALVLTPYVAPVLAARKATA